MPYILFTEEQKFQASEVDLAEFLYQRRFEIVRKRLRNFVIFQRSGGNKKWSCRQKLHSTERRFCWR